MKISLSGAQCTGKTTLMKQVMDAGKLFQDFTAIQEVVRTIKARKGPNFEFNKSNDFESQDLILTEHHRNVLTHESLITDRGAVDAFAYATKNYLDGLFSFREWKQFETIFSSTHPKYDMIFYLPIGMIPLEGDGVRSIDPDYQIEMDQIFKWVFDEYDIDHIILDDPLDERFEMFKEMIFSDHTCCNH